MLLRSECQVAHIELSVLLVLSYKILTVASVTSITKDPQSMTVLVGGTATFQCAGIGDYVLWKINGQSYQESSAQDSQFFVTRETVPSSKLSNLTVLTASTENNGTTVQCVLITFSPTSSASSNNATLTVLPGIGNIRNMNFDDDTSTISWDSPQTAGVLGNLFYQLVVSNNNTGVVIINTTTALTSYYYPFERCQDYVGKVTPHVGNNVGETVVKKHRTASEYYNLLIESNETTVTSYNNSHSATLFSINIFQQNLLISVCPGQVLMSVTYPTMHHSERTLHEGKVIEQPGVIEYTVYVEKKCHCIGDILIIADDREVEKKKTYFSTFDVQHCDVHTDHTSYILVECTFTINSTSPGFVLIQEEQSQYSTINTTLQQHEGDMSKGSVIITDLSAGEYSVTVYDEVNDKKPAYVHCDLLHINNTYNQKHVQTFNTTAISATSTVLITRLTVDNHQLPDQSPSQYHENNFTMVVLISTGVFSTVTVLGTTVLISLCLIVIIARRRHVKGADVTDHIPVDDNPVYITMKKIHLNKNSAYDTVKISYPDH